MSLIQIYLDDLKKELNKLKIDETVFHEYESNFLEEYHDFITEFQKTFEDPISQKEFLDSREPLEVIIKSLTIPTAEHAIEHKITTSKSNSEVKEIIFSKFLNIHHLVEPMVVMSFTLGIIILTALFTEEYKYFVLEFFSIPILYLLYRFIVDFSNYHALIGQNNFYLFGISILKICYLFFWFSLFISLEDFIITYVILAVQNPFPDAMIVGYLLSFIMIASILFWIYLIIKLHTKEKLFILNQKTDFKNLIVKIDKNYWLNVLKLLSFYTISMIGIFFIFTYLSSIAGITANYRRSYFSLDSAVESLITGSVSIFSIFTLLIQISWILGFYVPFFYIFIKLYKGGFQNDLSIILYESYRMSFFFILYIISLIIQFFVIISNMKY